MPLGEKYKLSGKQNASTRKKNIKKIRTAKDKDKEKDHHLNINIKITNPFPASVDNTYATFPRLGLPQTLEQN